MHAFLTYRHPLALMLPATLAGSFAFISPIATPANAIAYSMGALSVSELARVVRGFVSFVTASYDGVYCGGVCSHTACDFLLTCPLLATHTHRARS